ncbi:MAG: ABC transporter ATP-binding protein [Anaerolineae bacterium]|nr:ABC transporter ATP-binding protein [Anaerolineae bacterium]
MTTALPLLQITDLHVSRQDHEILRGIDLSVERGTVHAVLGLNGSGKSTLAYSLMALAGYQPTRGHILLSGQDITALGTTERARLGITLAWQEPARFEGLTVQQYLDLGQKQPSHERLVDALRAVNLDETYLNRRVDEALSGGERKRIELAAVYAMRPKLAILDEPDSGIDTLSLDDIGALIHRMAAEDITVLLISHRDEMVARADHASLICEGRVVVTDDPDTVCVRYTHCCQPCLRSEPVEMEDPYERL